jgi:uncharacterized membrane protein
MNPTTTTTDTVTNRVVKPGAAAGLAAALVMALFWMLVSAAQGAGLFTPLKLIGATFYAGAAMTYDTAAVLFGLMAQLAFGLAFGVIFAALTRRVRAAQTLVAAGLAYGAAIMLLMTYTVLPWASPILFATIDTAWFFVFHLVFGLTLPVALELRRRQARRVHAWVPPDEARSRP